MKEEGKNEKGWKEDGMEEGMNEKGWKGWNEKGDKKINE